MSRLVAAVGRLTIVASLAVAAAVWPRCAEAQDEQDFVFTDAEGHLVLRFAGAGPGDLDRDQWEEIFNVSVSTMVHDRLRADTAFEAEPVDSEWAHSMESRIERHVTDTGPAFTGTHVECRSASCRLVLEHASTWRVSEHQSLMGIAQRVVEAFIAANPAGFEPVFLIAAHYQEPERPYLKLFLRRATPAPGDRRTGR